MRKLKADLHLHTKEDPQGKLGDVHKIINFLDRERCLEGLANGRRKRGHATF